MKFFRIPFAIGLTIDDMGWAEGKDDRPYGPPRLNCEENPISEFYSNIIKLGENCGTRVQGSFVMSEFDRNNICGKPEYNRPLAPIDMTEKGLDWKYSCSEDQAKAMEITKEGNAYLELGLHGVRHGHYEKEGWHSSEWAERPPRDEKDRFITEKTKVTPWDSENRTSKVIADCYKELLRQYFTEKELSFPESFAPPTHVLYYDENDITTGAVLSQYGVKYCNAKITGKVKLECPIPKEGIIDHGMHILERRSLRAVPFDDSSHVPSLYPRKYPWIEAHFKDFWYTEKQWSQFLYNINSKKNFMLAKNTEQVHSQYFYTRYAKITNLPGKIIIDTTKMPEEVYKYNLLSSLILKVPLGKKEHISSVKCPEGVSFCGYYKDIFRHGYITLGSSEYMGRLTPGRYIIEYTTGGEMPCFFADNSLSTYNLYNTDNNNIYLKVYGTQTIRIKCGFKPKSVISEGFEEKGTDYKNGYFYATLKAKSMNGTTGRIRLE